MAMTLHLGRQTKSETGRTGDPPAESVASLQLPLPLSLVSSLDGDALLAEAAHGLALALDARVAILQLSQEHGVHTLQQPAQDKAG